MMKICILYMIMDQFKLTSFLQERNPSQIQANKTYNVKIKMGKSKGKCILVSYAGYRN